MEQSAILSWFTAQSPATIVVLVLLAMLLLYLGRGAGHGLLQGVFLALYRMLRIGARSLTRAERRLNERNREVLLEQGRQQAERDIEREFRRVNTVVERDLAGYPALQRTITEQITHIEEDYKRTDEVPPPSPDWIKAVEAVAKLYQRSNGDGIGARVLEEIHKASEQQHRDVLADYRAQVRERHAKLDGMKVYWRKLTNTVDEVGKVIAGLLERSREIDGKMAQYEEIVARSDKAERMLKASALNQFLVSALVVAIAIGGIFINFHLIALPMSETVSAVGRVAGMKVSDVAGMFVILLEATFGLMLMESLRITRLFPAIGAMDDKILKRMAWIFFAFLFAFACVEAALAFMRDQIAADNAALRQSLTGAALEPTVNSWIPMAGQMIMGFVLPFALAFVAIPLESLVHSGRVVVGDGVALLLRLLATVLRMLASGLRQLGQMLTHAYDLLIIPFLWCERLWHRRSASRQQPVTEPEATAPTTDHARDERHEVDAFDGSLLGRT